MRLTEGASHLLATIRSRKISVTAMILRNYLKALVDVQYIG